MNRATLRAIAFKKPQKQTVVQLDRDKPIDLPERIALLSGPKVAIRQLQNSNKAEVADLEAMLGLAELAEKVARQCDNKLRCGAIFDLCKQLEDGYQELDMLHSAEICLDAIENLMRHTPRGLWKDATVSLARDKEIKELLLTLPSQNTSLQGEAV